MKTALLQLASIVGIAFLAGTGYTLATGKLEFFVSSSRYPNAFVCRRSSDEGREVTVPPAPGPEPELLVEPDSDPDASPEKSGVEPTPPPPVEKPQGIPHITFDEAHQAWLDGILFVDARPSQRYEEGHIPGAVSIPAWEPGIEQKVEELSQIEPLAAPVVIYCTRAKDCEDSHIVGSHLEGFGYLDLKVFEGGFPEWQEREMPVREGEEPGPRGMVEEGSEP